MYSNCDTPNLISKGHLIFLPNPVPNFSSTIFPEFGLGPLMTGPY